MFTKKLLVATDFSVRSRQALRYAVSLAQPLGADIELLHVVAPPSTLRMIADAYLDRPLPTVSEEVLADARLRLNEELSAIAHSGVHITPIVEAGDPAATVVRMAIELPADLIVVATHARTGLNEMVLGSVAHKVISCAPCPVISLRGDELAKR